MISSSLLELFDGRFDASSCGPDVIKDEVGSVRIDGEFGIDRKCLLCLKKTGSFVGTNLDGILSANKKWR